MGVKKIHAESNCLYYITFTCQYWLSLFQLAEAYDTVYKWFDVITQKGFKIVSFVIMPNHIHLVILTPMEGETVNRLVGNGKRFMAYEIIKRLNDKKENTVLERLKNAVTVSEKARGKLHKVFRESFDASSDFGCCTSGLVTVNPCNCTPCHKLEETNPDSIIPKEYPITVFPNPAEGYCFIQGFSSEDEDAIITICNLSGQVLNRQKIFNKKGNWKYKIDLPQTGMYLINLTSENQNFHSSVISIKE